ncbi:oxidoreductase domain-containing protein [Burkholderia pseudomallei]|nr:oxidoreductase domain-containing protein [Burkholderia pseudomallei]VCD15369.1 oxidoreductase domain-containing protein [Burkholderia pseudomallei]VCD19204.1 oxidoreductase domain-containing protein [Burkholderia pseudomallei]VCD27668.1 oxidoreductase domain-containing protein [Burkholderia pseudomallei]VCD28048.1 oxidoreductase domain-containing protein [Burkholderia pseudomallei]
MATNREPDMKRLRIAVVGPGRISRAHLTAIRNNGDVAELAVIAGLPEEAERTRALAAEFGAGAASDDFDAVLADPSIDAVVLTLPNHLHKEAAVKSLDAGKHVLVEKPLANTVQEADAMIASARRNGRVLMTAQCRRFFPAALEARRRVGELGRPLSIVHVLGVNVERAQADWWRSAQKTGGLALGLNGPHVIDTILWLIGERPTRVFAQTGHLKRGDWEGEDEATVSIAFADGSLATGHLSFNMRPDTNERWICGPNGTLRLEHDRSLWIGQDPLVEKQWTPYIDGDESFDGQFREFANAINEGRAPLASAEEVRTVVEVLSAAAQSARSGLPVDL